MELFRFLMKLLTTVTGATLLTSCASSQFKVTSDPPEAEIFLVMSENNERKPLGKTPLEMPKADLQEQLPPEISAGSLYTIVLSKPGFKEQSFSLPYGGFGVSLSHLDVKMTPSDDQAQLGSAEDLLKRLFLAQRLALTQQFERALIEVDSILARHPKFARALSMKGSIYLAQKKYDDSLKWYEEALKADPEMEETVKLAARVRELIGGARAPANR